MSEVTFSRTAENGARVMSSRNIPPESVVFAVAFLNLGAVGGVIISGKANEQIAQELENSAEHVNLVLTQKAISDALDNPEALGDGTPVMQMHRHCAIVIRTFPALRCALERFNSKPDQIVLIAHPRHIKRASMILKHLYGGEIMEIRLGPVLYQDDRWYRSLQWTLKNSIGWVVDYLLVLSIKHPTFSLLGTLLAKIGFIVDCPPEVRLPKMAK